MNNIKGLSKNSNEYKLYKRLEELMKDIKCGNEQEKISFNDYLAQLTKDHWKLLEDIQNKTGKKKDPICSVQNCESISQTVESTKKKVSFLKKQFVTMDLICSNLIPRHFKLLLTLKKNKDKLNDNNTVLYQHILTNFVDLLIKLGLIKYARWLDPNHPNVLEIRPNEFFYGGKKTKKQTPLQILKLKHRNQLNNLKNKQKNDVLKLKSKHQKNLKKLST